MSDLMVSISGVRGIIGDSLGPIEAVRFGMALGTFLRRTDKDGTTTVCIGRDSRPSGAMMASSVIAGLTAAGCGAIDLGIVTTPGAALMVRHLNCAGGVVITASHNPAQWNGIKFIRSDGIAFPDEQARQIRQHYFDGDFDVCDAANCGRVSTSGKTHAVHVDTVLQICDKLLIGSKRFRVVLDSINGAGCVVTAHLLSALGCELIHINGRADGNFAHQPEPTAENLRELGPSVSAHRAAVGFAQDPDADRLAVIDELGNYIGEEYTLALAAKYIFAKGPGTAVANLSTSRMIDRLAKDAGCSVIRTPVGEAHVANAIIQNGAVIGGEGNGGVIDPRVVPVRDSLVGIALILELMAETGQPLSELVSQIPRYHMVKTKFPCPAGRSAELLEAVRRHYEGLGDSGDIRVDISDGIRIDLPDGWVHLRASNTEPIMRIIAESNSPQRTDELIAQIKGLIPAS